MSAPQRVMLSYILGNNTGSVVLDASVNETHTTTAQVTDHQVEQGPNISDHIRPMPQRISIDGIVTNHPIDLPETQAEGITVNTDPLEVSAYAGQKRSPVGQRVMQTVKLANVLQFDGEFDRVKAVHEILIACDQGGALFSIFTTLRSYDNMAIETLSVVRNAENGNSLRFQLDMKEIRLVQSEVVQELPSKKKNAKHRGSQPTKPVGDDKPKLQSFAKGLIHSVFGG